MFLIGKPTGQLASLTPFLHVNNSDDGGDRGGGNGDNCKILGATFALLLEDWMTLFFSKAVTGPTTVQQVTSAVTSVEPYKLKRRTLGLGTSLGLWDPPAVGGV